MHVVKRIKMLEVILLDEDAFFASYSVKSPAEQKVL